MVWEGGALASDGITPFPLKPVCFFLCMQGCTKLKGPGGGPGSGGVSVMRSLAELQDTEVVPAWKRPNPKQRKKLKVLREAQ